MKNGSLGCLLVLAIAPSLFAADSPRTINNDDSCEVIVTPAATLLLPYFEVDLTNRAGETTLFTITNVTQSPQIANVTLWTDLGYPALYFNIFLTGYDVQAINLFDVIARGRIAEPGTTSDSEVGRRSLDNDENPLLDIRNCDNLAVNIPEPLLSELRAAFTTGRVPSCGTSRIGRAHTNAVGYATIDVVAVCDVLVATDAAYFTKVLLYDNVLIGDFEQVNRSKNFAQGGSMVHIRAVPEGGATGVKITNLERTFYSRFQSGGTSDRRQPLPSTFAARWIQGDKAGFATSFKIWRESRNAASADCSVSANDALVTEIVRFDEMENPTHLGCVVLCDPPSPPLSLPAASRVSSFDTSTFPPNVDDSVAGWMYFNLDRASEPLAEDPAQSWVVVSMTADGRYSGDFDAASFGNGCSAAVAATDRDGAISAIGPPSESNATFTSGSPSTTNNDDSCDIRVTAAATLLLPYFEVDLSNPANETTLFTVTNVTRLPQIARVTVWTDAAYPLYSFNVFLTGYDVQSINLFDVIGAGKVPATGSDAEVGRHSSENDANPLLTLQSCEALADSIPQNILADLRSALTSGRASGCGTAPVGMVHTHAIGYLTVDVVANCGPSLPTDAGYFTTDLLFDNVLIGDYQQVSASNDFAQAGTMVHIRAIPEGGRAGVATNLVRTFYSRYQSGGTSDRRQPLPSTFAARWISGGSTGFSTSFKVWREGPTGAAAGCSVAANRVIPLLNTFVRFDEEENPTTWSPNVIILVPAYNGTFPAVSRVSANDQILPPNPDSALSGWMYFSLDNPAAKETPVDLASQSWVIVSMRDAGRYSVDFDAASMGNGCSPPAAVTDEDGGPPAVGPSN
jgi:hypothetical protein